MTGPEHYAKPSACSPSPTAKTWARQSSAHASQKPLPMSCGFWCASVRIACGAEERQLEGTERAPWV